MPSYDFEVWQGDRALHSVKGVELERPAHAWDASASSRGASTQPGCRIAVKDESGDIAILVGARTAKQHASGAGGLTAIARKKKAPAEVVSGGGLLR